LLKGLLTANPQKRISAEKALSHVWFKGEIASRESMPKMNPVNEVDRAARKKVKTTSEV
jgi:hypothetical protein